MSAKAKASEVGPAASTYIRLQQAYIMETGKGPGSEKDIGYSLPGGGETSNFKYSVASSGGTWDATALAWISSVAECTASAKWTVTVTEASIGATPGCKTLTPNFENLAKN